VDQHNPQRNEVLNVQIKTDLTKTIDFDELDAHIQEVILDLIASILENKHQTNQED